MTECDLEEIAFATAARRNLGVTLVGLWDTHRETKS
jgi:hypothetical protein